MTEDSRDRLLDSIQEISRKENDILYRDLRSEIGELEQRVNSRLIPLERKMELPRRVTAMFIALAGMIGGGVITVLIDKLTGGGG